MMLLLTAVFALLPNPTTQLFLVTASECQLLSLDSKFKKALSLRNFKTPVYTVTGAGFGRRLVSIWPKADIGSELIVPTDLRETPTKVTHESLGLTGFSLISQEFDLLTGHDRPGNRVVTSVRQHASWKVPDNFDFGGTLSPTSLLFLTTNGPRIVSAIKGQISVRSLTSAEIKDQRVKVDLWLNKGFSMVDSTSDRWLLMKPGSPALILGPTKQVRILFDQRPAPPNSVSVMRGQDAICYTRFRLEKGGTRIYLNIYNSKGLRKSASWFLEGMTSPVVYSLVLPD